MLYNSNHSSPPEVHERNEQKLLEAITELKVITHFLKEGLNVTDDPETVREDVQNEAD